jgi:hypothetical protein
MPQFLMMAVSPRQESPAGHQAEVRRSEVHQPRGEGAGPIDKEAWNLTYEETVEAEGQLE